MPINADIDFANAQRDYYSAKSKEEKLAALKKMLATAPKHKGAQKLLKEIKDKISELKEGVEKERRQKKSGGVLAIKKEGAAQIAFVGLPNSGKSYILEKLSGSPVEQKEYPFSTHDPEVRMIDLDGAKLQGVEIPAIYEGFLSSERGPELFSIIRNSDLVIIVVDGTGNIQKQVESVLSEFSKAEVELTRDRREQKGFLTFIPAIILVNRKSHYISKLSNLDVLNFKDLSVPEIQLKMWQHIPLVRVYTRSGNKVAPKPVVMKKGATVRELAERVHKDFVKNFKYAKIWGSGIFPGQQVGLDYILKDKDVVEVYTN